MWHCFLYNRCLYVVPFVITWTTNEVYVKSIRPWIALMGPCVDQPSPRLTHWARDEIDDILQTTFLNCIFLNGNVWISITISLEFVPKGRINYIPALVQIMAGRRPGGKPLSEPIVVRSLTHICVTQPQCVNNPLALWDIPSEIVYKLKTKNISIKKRLLQ